MRVDGKGKVIYILTERGEARLSLKRGAPSPSVLPYTLLTFPLITFSSPSHCISGLLLSYPSKLLTLPMRILKMKMRELLPLPDADEYDDEGGDRPDLELTPVYLNPNFQKLHFTLVFLR